MNDVILARLQRIGGRVRHEELAYQLAKKDGLKLSDDELANAVRRLELDGQVEVTAVYRAVDGD